MESVILHCVSMSFRETRLLFSEFLLMLVTFLAQCDPKVIMLLSEHYTSVAGCMHIHMQMNTKKGEMSLYSSHN